MKFRLFCHATLAGRGSFSLSLFMHRFTVRLKNAKNLKIKKVQGISSFSFDLSKPDCRIWQNSTRSCVCRANFIHMHCVQYDFL